MTKVKILALLAGMVLLLVLPSTVAAQRLPPHVFVGTATIDDVAAPAGTTISAWVDGAEASSTTTTGDGGDYVLQVDQGDLSYADETVSFLVGGFSADQSATWVQGGGDELNLSAASGAVATAEAPAEVPAAAGVPGERGPTGRTGRTGATGPEGPAGVSGARGQIGYSGPAGGAGPDGPQGDAGLQGSTGSVGSQGPAGPIGVDGERGVLSIIALILAIIGIVGAGGAFLVRRRS